MVQPSRFKHLEFEWDEYNLDELAGHSVGYLEVEECFYNRHSVFRNKTKPRRNYETFKLEGQTDAGRRLLVIFFVREKSRVRLTFGAVALIRAITAWEI